MRRADAIRLVVGVTLLIGGLSFIAVRIALWALFG